MLASRQGVVRSERRLSARSVGGRSGRRALAPCNGCGPRVPLDTVVTHRLDLILDLVRVRVRVRVRVGVRVAVRVRVRVRLRGTP